MAAMKGKSCNVHLNTLTSTDGQVIIKTSDQPPTLRQPARHLNISRQACSNPVYDHHLCPPLAGLSFRARDFPWLFNMNVTLI